MDGYGGIAIGATLKDVQSRYSAQTSNASDFDDNCRLYSSRAAPGLTLYVQKGVVTRVDVDYVRLASNIWIAPPIRTDRKIGLGSSEAEVRTVYGPLMEWPSRSPGGALYVGNPREEKGLLFEFRDGEVEKMAAGTNKALRLNEGCL